MSEPIKVLYNSGVMTVSPDGKAVSFTANPIYDIIKALSRECRFGGHTNRFVSVLEHSINCADKVYELTEDPLQALQAAFHEVGEGLGLRDVNSGLKHAFAKPLVKLEHVIMKAVFELIKVPYPLSETVIDVDHKMALAEGLLLLPSAYEIMKPNDPHYSLYIHGYSPEQAEEAFYATNAKYRGMVK